MEMKKDFKIIKAAIGINEVGSQVAHVSVPTRVVTKERGKIKVVGQPWVVTSKKDYWPMSQEEQEKRGIYAQSLPKFGLVESRWYELDIRRYLEWKNHILDPKKQLFDLIKKTLEEHIDFYRDGYVEVVTCWVIGSFLFPAFSAYPYLFLTGPRGSGKTKLLDVIGYMAFNAESTSSVTPASVFRIVEANQATLLIDEAEMLKGGKDNLELKLILNAGYKPGKPVTRTNTDTMEVERFLVYSPKAIASINQIDSTLKSRGIEVNMIKTSSKSKGNRRVTDRSGDWWKIRDALYRYLLDYVFDVQKIYEESEEVNKLQCRKNELWSPLLAIALHIDKGVFDVVAKAAVGDSKGEESTIDDWHASLLKGLKDVVTVHKDYVLSDLRDAMLRYLEIDEKDNVSSRWVGSALVRFGFSRGSRQSTGMTYSIDPEKVNDLLVRYQLVESEDSVGSVDKSGGVNDLVTTVEEIFGSKAY